MIERYSTQAMTNIWSDAARFERWTQIEVAACEAFAERGEIPAQEMEAIRQHKEVPSPDRVAEIETTTNHDVVAFVRALGEIVGEPASRHLHRGLTSSDVVDTALAMAIRDALEVLVEETQALQQAIGERALEHKRTPCAGRTHGVHAEPTTFGLRLLGWYCEIGRHVERLKHSKLSIAHGKLSGAVGTYSQTDPALEAFVLQRLNLAPEPVATQVVPRDRHAEVLSTLALLGGGIERIATDIRALQRTEVREAEEAFAKGQTGSSAMPHKRNPILSERLTGMARLLRAYMLTGFENMALWHERDISHSSVERVTFPDAFHLAHYMIRKCGALIRGLRIYPENMHANMERTKGLLFSQNVLGCLLGAGLDRHLAYKAVQEAAMQVWDGHAASFRQALEKQALVQKHVSAAQLDDAFDLRRYQRHVDALFARAGLYSSDS